MKLFFPSFCKLCALLISLLFLSLSSCVMTGDSMSFMGMGGFGPIAPLDSGATSVYGLCSTSGDCPPGALCGANRMCYGGLGFSSNNYSSYSGAGMFPYSYY